MSVSSNILRFPGAPEKPWAPPAPVPPLDTFDVENTKTLGTILDTALLKAKILIDFMHQDRKQASMAGIEGLSVEIAALLDSDKFSKMKTALFEATRLGEGVTLTHDGLGRFHRLETLVSEGMQLFDRYKESGRKPVLAGPAVSPMIAQATKPAVGPDTILLGAIIMFGAVAITVAAFLLARREQPVRIVSGSAPFLDRPPVDEVRRSPILDPVTRPATKK